LLVRRSSILWAPVPVPGQRSLWKRMREPESPLGNGPKVWFCSKAPMLIHQLPERLRIEIVRRVLGPAGAYWLRERVVDRLPILLGHSLRHAEARGARIMLQVSGPDGHTRTLTADHVIAATGYRFDVRSLPFLSQEILAHLHRVHQIPLLSRNFESSVSGLYFSGLASTYSFGPVMRFLYGAHYTARRMSHSIATDLGHHPSFAPVALTPASNREAS
jgi:hypothetical protein